MEMTDTYILTKTNDKENNDTNLLKTIINTNTCLLYVRQELHS